MDNIYKLFFLKENKELILSKEICDSILYLSKLVAIASNDQHKLVESQRNDNSQFLLGDAEEISYEYFLHILSYLKNGENKLSKLFTKLSKDKNVLTLIQLYDRLGLSLPEFRLPRLAIDYLDTRRGGVEFLMNLALDKHDVRNKSDGSISDCIHNILIRPKVYGPRLRHHTTVIVKAKCPQDILSTEIVQWMEKVSKEEEIDNGTDGEPSPPMAPEPIPSMSGDGDHLYDVDFYRYCGALREEWQEYNWKIKNLE